MSDPLMATVEALCECPHDPEDHGGELGVFIGCAYCDCAFIFAAHPPQVPDVQASSDAQT